MSESNFTILILNKDTKERELLFRICSRIGSVHSASDIKTPNPQIESTRYNVLVVDQSLSEYTSLKIFLEKTTSIIILGKKIKKIEEIIREWPHDYCVAPYTSPLQEENNDAFLRILKTAADYSKLKEEVKTLRQYIAQNEGELKNASSKINEIKSFIQSSVVKELEKRIAIESKYLGFKREKQKIEAILKNLYTANDVTNLLDIVHDIKEIVQAEGISLYILDQNEMLGKFLNPLVWDDTILSHPDSPRYTIPLDSQDFAANVAQQGEEINIPDFSQDKRMSHRYMNQLKSPLKSILSAPIKHDKETIGVLEVYNKIQKKDVKMMGFSAEDQHVMRRLSEHISIAITKLNLIQYDALTGLLRPEPFFDKILQKMKLKRKRHQEGFSYALVMGDVDWFKNYNDRNGHEAGNKLLKELAKVLKSSIREEDLLCRYGGEEFMFFLTTIKSQEEAFGFTERIRKNIESHHFEHQDSQPRKNLTMSFGIAHFAKESLESLESLTKKDLIKTANEADMALAVAKGKKITDSMSREEKEAASNKNRTCVYSEKLPEKPKIPPPTVSPSQKTHPRDRRKFQRFFISSYIIYKKDNGPNLTKTIDLSFGGAKIYTEGKLPSNDIFDLTLMLGSNACQCRGNVVYSEKQNGNGYYYYSGLKFKEITTDNRQILGDFLASLPTKETIYS